MNETTDKNIAPIRMTVWEQNAFLIESILLGALSAAAVMLIGHRLTSAAITEYVWIACGFVVLSLILLPVHRVHVRNAHGGELPILRSIAGTLVGAAIASAIYVAMS